MQDAGRPFPDDVRHKMSFARAGLAVATTEGDVLPVHGGRVHGHHGVHGRSGFL
ncbi:MAG: hypothetical protein R2751_17205 [Bacteroidales bacterium]